MQISGAQLDKRNDYQAAGITHLICAATGPDYDLSLLQKLIAWQGEQVVGSV